MSGLNSHFHFRRRCFLREQEEKGLTQGPKESLSLAEPCVYCGEIVEDSQEKSVVLGREAHRSCFLKAGGPQIAAKEGGGVGDQTEVCGLCEEQIGEGADFVVVLGKVCAI